jgi:hypothetical protein
MSNYDLVRNSETEFYKTLDRFLQPLDKFSTLQSAKGSFSGQPFHLFFECLITRFVETVETKGFNGYLSREYFYAVNS